MKCRSRRIWRIKIQPTLDHPVADEPSISTNLQLQGCNYFTSNSVWLNPPCNESSLSLQWQYLLHSRKGSIAILPFFLCLYRPTQIGHKPYLLLLYQQYARLSYFRCLVGTFYMMFNHCHWSVSIKVWLTSDNIIARHQSTILQLCQWHQEAKPDSNHPHWLLPFRFLHRHLDARCISQVLGSHMVLHRIPSLNHRG